VVDVVGRDGRGIFCYLRKFGILIWVMIKENSIYIRYGEDIKIIICLLLDFSNYKGILI